jgi:TolB-like protein
MTNKKYCFIIIVIFLCCYIYTIGCSEDKLNMAVAGFEGKGVSEVEANTVSDFLREELINLEKYNIVDRANMNLLLDEQQFQYTGCTSQECVVKMGRILNAQVLVVGSVIKLKDIYYITADVVDVEYGKVVMSEKIDASSLKKLLKKTKNLAKQISKIKPSIFQNINNGISSVLNYIFDTDKQDKIKDSIQKISKPEFQATSIVEIINSTTVVINSGSFDGVKKRDVYRVENEKGLVAKLYVIDGGLETAQAKVAKLYGKQQPKPGDSARYYANRKFVGYGIYLTGDINNGNYRSMYYDNVDLDDRGYHISFGDYTNIIENVETHTKNNYLGTDYAGQPVYSERWIKGYKEIKYFSPILIFRTYKNYDTYFSPYIGAGICSATMKKINYDLVVVSNYVSSTGRYVYGSSGETSSPSVDEQSFGLVFNCGIDFFSTEHVHVNLDLKCFEHPFYFGKDALKTVLNFGLGYFW